MSTYIATCFTHLSAMMSRQALEQAGVAARLAPVPRSLSSSCGSCVRYAADHPCERLLDADTERVYEEHDGTYELLFSYE